MNGTEKLTNKYGRLYIKHWKSGNEKMAKYYHNKLHDIYEQAKICPACFGKKYFIVSHLESDGKITKSYKQRCVTCNAKKTA